MRGACDLQEDDWPLTNGHGEEPEVDAGLKEAEQPTLKLLVADVSRGWIVVSKVVPTTA